jgi:hypothetical protein
MTMVLMMRPAEMSAKMNVNMHAEEVRAEMNFDSGGDSEDERRQRRLRCMQRRLLHWQRRLHLDP